MPNHQPLTASFVKSCTAPGRYGDGRGSKGLRLVVSPSNVAPAGVTKSWVAEARGVDGRRVARGLGSYPAVSLTQARKLAAENYVAIKAGNVAGRSLSGVTSPTLSQALDLVIPLRKMKPETVRDWRSSLERHAADLMKVRVAFVTSAHVMGVLEPIWQSKPALGRKVLQRLGGVMDWAKANNYRDDNPCDAVRAALPKNDHEATHHRALAWAEVPAALRRTQGYRRPMVARLFEFVVATAVRINEARGVTWQEIDFETRVWTVPAERMKANREHRVPLSSFALGVLAEAQRLADQQDIASRYVFPAASGEPLHRGVPIKMFAELGIDTTTHGLRSTFSDWAIDAGYDSMTVHRATAHEDRNAVRAAYQRTDRLEERRLMMQAWGKFVSS